MLKAVNPREKNKRNSCLYLLIGLIGLLLAQPFFLHTEEIGRIMLSAFIFVVLLAGLFAIRAKKRDFVIALLFGGPAFIGTFISVFFENELLGAISLGLVVFFLAFTTGSILAYVIGAGKVTMDKLFGSACVYLLIGLTFAAAYMMILQFQPDAVRVSGENEQIIVFSDLVFFSFTTLTTLGYGDITPISAHARTLAAMEAVTGVLFLALLIARLVALYTTYARDEGSPSS